MSANSLRLHCFGGLWLEGPDGPLADAASQRRRLALLALVAGSGPAGISRDRVLAYLWPASDSDHARRALAQLTYSMRRSHGQALLLGDAELRLDPESLASDVTDFLAAAENPATMAALYSGPFLDGFHLADAPEFARWVERERDRLSGLAGGALERAAATANAAGDPDLAATFWRRRAALNPLEPGPALGLMSALAAAGDRAGAIQHGRVYRDMVRAELEMEPDRRVTELSERIQRDNAAPSLAGGASAAAPATPAPLSPQRRASDRGGNLEAPARRRWFGAAAIAAIAGLALLAMSLAVWPTQDAPHLLAVGAVRALTPGSSADADAFVDLLATSLARVDGMQVLSNTLIQERVAGLRHADPDATPARAAAEAGAREILEGTVRQAGDGLQLDLRRVSLASGAVLEAYRVRGRDLFELADAATTALAGGFGLAPPATAIATVTTHSLPAYRLYQAGLRAFNDGDMQQAYPLFAAAVAEDSTFPMAAYYAWRAALGASLALAEAGAYRQLLQVSGRGTERERLFIEGTIAALLMNVSAVAKAETLAIRYPSEPSAHLMLAHVHGIAGDYARSISEARLVRRMDTVPAASDAACRRCDAFAMEIGALVAMDSLPAAERVARSWVQQEPRSVGAHGYLLDVLERRSRFPEAESVLATIDAMGRTPRRDDVRPIVYLIRGGRFAEADARLRPALLGAPAAAGAARWLLLISLRNQGRFAEAQALATSPDAESLPMQARGHALFEVGRFAESADWFDSLAALPNHRSEGNDARSRTWALAHLATAVAAAGDTARLGDIAIALERSGVRSLYGRDRVLHHYARALLLAARGDEPGAATEFTAAISSPTEGFTRIQYQLARIRLRQHRPAEAVALLEPALRGSIDASNYYVTRTELHELLGRAYEQAGRSGEAATEYEVVAAAWSKADPGFAQRASSAGLRARALRQPGP